MNNSTRPVALRNGVVVPSTHVKERILALVLATAFDVMVAEDRVKGHAVGYQACERPFKMCREIFSVAVRIDIVAGCDHEIEGALLVSAEHLTGNAHRIMTVRAPVADDGKTDSALYRFGAENRCRPYQSAGSKGREGLNSLSSGYQIHHSLDFILHKSFYV